jgi:hypothetical protein
MKLVASLPKSIEGRAIGNQLRGKIANCKSLAQTWPFKIQ